MAGGTLGDDDDVGVITEINVTPLVDVMLCLLVIFMVTTTYVAADSLKVDLPEASTGGKTEPSTLMVTYTVDEDSGKRTLYLNGNPIEEAGLRLHIKNEIARGVKDLQAVIAADQKVSHGEVIHLIDVVKQEGVHRFALNIESGASALP